ncbi:hypothetical protein [Limoniibacter endophyticus]|uniref:Uncharacterized protein n=1 Tax=Limoniibacter endophyticus TaxID=1565040 RepID=A0A8J3GIS2_9HYPH|nr:hypothetical protein [Limoniibacter endophyticus]GHC73914.1 hypothetical protein GCM10010136_22500 [Limoniibacter endophyticus]
MANPNDDDQKHSRQILRRVVQQSEPVMHNAGNQEDDRIEYWGRKIGRILSIVVFLGIVIYLIAQLREASL